MRRLVLLLLLISIPASAADFEVKVGAGLANAVLDRNVTAVPVLAGSGAVDFPFQGIAFTGRLRLLHLPTTRNGWGGDLMGGVRIPLGDRAFTRMTAGVGASGACVRGDYCGGAGVAGSLEVGGAFPVSDALSLVLNGDVTLQTGAANLQAGLLLTYGIATGIRF